MKSLNIYLNFSGNCQEAFEFYQSVFGGELTNRQTYGEIPGDQSQESEKNKLVHIRLQVGLVSLMGGDRPNSMGETSFGNAYTVSFQTEDLKEATQVFNGLATGGTVVMPLAESFWGSTFGMLNDKFGIQWMINCEKVV